MKRVYIGKHGKKCVDIFYAERTSNSNKLIIPSSIIGRTIKSSMYGKLCELKSGDYFMGREKVKVNNIVEQVHCGAGVITLE